VRRHSLCFHYPERAKNIVNSSLLKSSYFKVQSSIRRTKSVPEKVRRTERSGPKSAKRIWADMSAVRSVPENGPRPPCFALLPVSIPHICQSRPPALGQFSQVSSDFRMAHYSAVKYNALTSKRRSQ